MGYMESSDWSEQSVTMALPFRSSKSRNSRRDRTRKAEEDAHQKLTGDAHWSKLLQVNGSDADAALVRRLSGKRAKSPTRSHGCKRSREASRERNGGNAGGDGERCNSSGGGVVGGGRGDEAMCSVRVVTPRPREGLLATIASRIRHWLQARRKYEISPRDPFLNTSSSSTISTQSKGPGGKDAILKDSVLPDCDAALNRCGAGRLSPRLPQRLPNGFAAATAAETGKIPLQRSPVAPRHSKKQRSPATPSKTASNAPLAASKPALPAGGAATKGKAKSPAVDIKIEVVDVSGHSPSALSPSAHRLLASSRRHLLRQSRSKLKDRAVLITSLVPEATGLCHQPLTTTISCPPQAEVVAGAAGFGDPLLQSILRRCHSWPLPRRKAIPDDDECPDSAKEEALQSAGLNGQESLEDCSIRFDDLELGECIKTGRRCKIYKARWHGDVYVHLFGELVKRPDREGFWRDVAKLCRIRHENINLFMGACTMAPNLAVITSFIAGKSLFEHIHVQKEKMTLHSRVQVLQGVAQGMGYLHAKGIVLRKLNTSNIFLTPRVKVSAIDFSLSEARHNRKDYATIPRGHLTYVAPELLRTLKVVPPRLVPSSAPSPESDVFAFGTLQEQIEQKTSMKMLQTGSCGLHTLHNAFRAGCTASDWEIEDCLSSLFTLFNDTPARREDFLALTGCQSFPLKFCKHRTIMYEVLGGSYPYPGFPPESIIWSVCSGHRQNLGHVNCTMPLKTLIEECWSQEPLYRPDFPELSKELHKNSPQYKRHSSSEPERLNRSPGVLE